MKFKTLLSQPDISFRLKSIGLSLASPTDIRSWCFQYNNDDQSTPITGQIKNAKTIHYKSLLPEPGGLFCSTVFGPNDQQMSRDKMAYLELTLPLSHIWYLKGSPSYLSVLLNSKRKTIQSIIYGDCCLSFSKQTFNSNQNPLRVGHFKYFYDSTKSSALSNSFANPSLNVLTKEFSFSAKQIYDESSNHKSNQKMPYNHKIKQKVLPNCWIRFVAATEPFFYCQNVFSAQNHRSVIHFWEEFPFFCQNYPKIFQKVLQQKIGFYSSNTLIGHCSPFAFVFTERFAKTKEAKIIDFQNKFIAPSFSFISFSSTISTQTQKTFSGFTRNPTQSSILELFNKQNFDKLAFDQVFQKFFPISTLHSTLQSTSFYAEQKATHSTSLNPSYWINRNDNDQHYFWLIYLARNFFHTLFKLNFPMIWFYQCFLDRKNKLIPNNTQRLKQKLKIYRFLLIKLKLNQEQNNLLNSFEDLLFNKSKKILSFPLLLSEGLQKKSSTFLPKKNNVQTFDSKKLTFGLLSRQKKPSEQKEQPTNNKRNKFYYAMLQQKTEQVTDNVSQQPIYDMLQEKGQQCICGLNKYILLPQFSIETFVFQMPNYTLGFKLPLAYDYPYNPIPGWVQVHVNDNVGCLAQKSFNQTSQINFAYQILCDPLYMGTRLFTSDSKTLSIWLKKHRLKSKSHLTFEINDSSAKKPTTFLKNVPSKTLGADKLRYKTTKVHGLYDCFSLLQWGYICNKKETLAQQTAVLNWKFKKAHLDTLVDLKPLYTEIQCTKKIIKKQIFTAQATWRPVFYTPLNSLETWIEANVLQTLWQYHRQHHIVFLKMFYGFTLTYLKAIEFPLFYEPLSCKYNNLPKGFLRNSEGILRQHGLNNPLGHKNFRLFIQHRFRVSLQKSMLVAQLKQMACQCMRETISIQMQTSIDWIYNIVKSKSKLKKFFFKHSFDNLSYLIPIAKQKVLNNIVWYFSSQDQHITVDDKESQFNTISFILSQSLFKLHKSTKTTKAADSIKSIQPKKSKSTPFLMSFNQLGWSSIWTNSNHQTVFMSKKTATNVLFNHWEKRQWKPDDFFFLQQKKRLVHTIISTICHKINVFLTKSKGSLSIKESELDYINWPNLFPHLVRGQKSKTLSVKAANRFEKHKKEHKRMQFFYEDPEVWLNFFNLSKKATMLEYVKQFQTYFSLKTKLIKSKTVRLWFTKGFIKHNRLEQWPLRQLTWLVMIKSGSTVSYFDQIMYSRLRFQRRTAILPLKHGFSHCVETFLEQNNKLKNTFYLIKQSFSWPIEEDYERFVEFISPQPHKTDAIIPAYVNKCITFDQPRTGAWAIQSLLKQFKSIKPSIKPPIYGYIDYLKSQIQVLYKTMAFYTTFFQNLRVTPLKQTLHDEDQGELNNSFTGNFVILKPGHKSLKSKSNRRQKTLKNKLNPINKTTSKSLEIKQNLKVFYQRQLSQLQLKQTKLTRRLKLLLPFMHPNHCPAWLILTCLPILPPGLRPILSLNPGQFAIADLNKLYQQVIYRNERLKDLTELTVPLGLVNPYLGFRKLFRLYIRLIQQAVDALMDNGRSDSLAVVGNNGQPLKSLSESLRGKKGRFRQNLLGKRVDYSGRSVIVVGPQLQVHQCGLPKTMAVVLFQPFLLRALMHQNYKLNYLQAKKLIRNQHPIIWPILDKILQNHPVLLNRAPTLHRLGIQAFQPCLVSGQAILLHPLVCSAFNADFDGDQMAVHVPLSYDACSEAWKLMWSRNQLFSPAMGDPVLMPTQDMVLGCYYLSTWDSIKHQRSILQQIYDKPGYGEWFATMDQVLHAFWLHHLDEHQMIWLNWSGNFELEKHSEQCFEYQLNNHGAFCIFYDDLYQCSNTMNNLLKTWIKTTPGRVLLNQLCFKK
jgi:DNA-directed RNA polymerase beta' subunit